MTHGVNHINPTPDTLCAYTESLAQTFKSPKSVSNYISAVRLLHKRIGVTALSLDCFEVRLMLRALPLTMRHIPKQRLPITIEMLRKICVMCDEYQCVGVVLKFAFIISFFGFLRQSNVAPKSKQEFDTTRHSCRRDIVVAKPGLLVTLKWTKTIQSLGTPTVIPIPEIAGNALDPVTAYQCMLRAVPTSSPTDPLLMLPGGRMLTSRDLARALRTILTRLGVCASNYSLHSLRRGGASCSYRAGCSYIDIKRHGTWASNSFWTYVSSPAVERSPVAAALADAAK